MNVLLLGIYPSADGPMLEWFEKTFELAPGSLPRTLPEAWIMGYKNMVEAIRAVIGLDVQEWVSFLAGVVYPDPEAES